MKTRREPPGEDSHHQMRHEPGPKDRKHGAGEVTESSDSASTAAESSAAAHATPELIQGTAEGSVNAQRRADLLLELQQTHGNAYTRHLAHALGANAQSATPSLQRAPTKRPSHDAEPEEQSASGYQMKIEFDDGSELDMPVDSFSLGGSHASAASGGSGSREASAPHSPSITVTKPVGPSSPRLWQASADGKPIKKLTITMHTSGDGGKQETHALTLENVYVASIQTGAAKDSVSSESVVFTAAKISADAVKGDAPK